MKAGHFQISPGGIYEELTNVLYENLVGAFLRICAKRIFETDERVQEI